MSKIKWIFPGCRYSSLNDHNVGRYYRQKAFLNKLYRFLNPSCFFKEFCTYFSFYALSIKVCAVGNTILGVKLRNTPTSSMALLNSCSLKF
jgi:hypothetical protein